MRRQLRILKQDAGPAERDKNVVDTGGIMDGLIFGAAYYYEYAREERLERDMQLMREAGMNTIRIAESTWSVEEPRCGEFDFSHVTKVIETAARNGINVIIGTPTYAVPKWLSDMDPGVLGDNAFGSRQNMDITDPTYRYYAERIIRELVSRTAAYRNVIGYQIDNETKHLGVNNERIREGFRNWLKERFGTIEAVNEAYVMNHWSLSVSSFDELPDPEETSNGGYACAFEEYRREIAAEFLHWQAEIVSEYKRNDQFITHNFDYDWKELGAEDEQNGCSAGLQPDLNDFEAAKSLTVAGTDVYTPPCGQLTGRELAFAGDLMRPLKNAPYLVMESQTQAFPGWLPWPGQLRLMAMMHLASGTGGLMFWPWASIHGGKEAYWKGILSHDGEPGATYAEVKEIGDHFRKIGPALKTKARSRIALIVSTEALHALRHFPMDKDMSYNDIVNDYHRALYELNLECDVIYDREADWSGYDLLVIPALYCTSDGMIERMRAFVEGGGSILASFHSFFADENTTIRHDRQPHGMNDVFGMHYDRFTKNGCHHWMELLEPDTAEALQNYRDPHWKSFAALTHNRFGKGSAWYVGCDCKSFDLKRIISSAAAEAGIEVPTVQWPVIVKKRGELTFILNFSDQSQRITAEHECTDIISGTDYDEGSAIYLDAWGASVLI